MDEVDAIVDHLHHLGATAGSDWVDIPTSAGKQRLRVVYRGGARSELTAPQWRDLIDGEQGEVVVAHTYVNPQHALRYRQLGVPYIDVAGNAWLQFDGFRVFVDGRRQAAPAAREAPTNRAFTPAGVRVLFVLLVRPDLITAPMRLLANASLASLGSTQQALRSLAQLGYLDWGIRGRSSLRRREQLITEWVSAFAHRLLPKLETREAAGPSPEEWRRLARIEGFPGTIAGEAQLIDLVRPMTTTIYGVAPWADLVSLARIRPDRGAVNVRFRPRFWDEEVLRLGPNAPELLSYAELVASGDSRQLEIAERLRDDGRV